MMLSSFIEQFLMSKQYNQFPENQPKVKVAVQTRDTGSSNAWFVTLAVFFAGVFYFWGYYFWAVLWRVLTGG
jgi:hypothetical protein